MWRWCTVAVVVLAQTFDLFLLELEWKPTSCVQEGLCTNPHYEENAFNIHGLWPNFKGKNYGPTCCQGAESFKVEEIDPETRSEMDKYWMSYKNEKPRGGCRNSHHSRRPRGADESGYYGNEYAETVSGGEEEVVYDPSVEPEVAAGPSSFSFWEHEWTKHGSCSGLDLNTYFNTTVQLFKELNPLKKLQDNKIKPGADYKSKDILAALGELAVMKCADKPGSNYFLRIQYCFDLKNQPIECRDDGKRIINCDPEVTFRAAFS